MPKGIYKRTEKNIKKGKENPNYRGGNSTCIDCAKILSYRALVPKRCKPCWYKFSVNENSTNWKGGKEYPNCLNCNCKTSDWNSILCRKCYRGKLHPQWKGGVSKIQSLIRGMPENRQWIRQCMYRDNYCCLECGVESNGNNLQVDHIKQFALILKENNIDSIERARNCEELWDNNNGRTLCKSCHKLTETFNRKVN